MKKYSLFIFVLALLVCLQAFTAFAAVPSTQTAPSNTPFNVFKFEGDEKPEIYFTNQSAPIYLRMYDDHEAYGEIVKALAETKVIRLSRFNSNSGIDTGFFVKCKADNYMINLRPGGIIEINGEAYGTTAKQYNRLVGLGNDDYKKLKSIAQWCAFMSYQKITKVEYSAKPGSKPLELTTENMRIAAKELHELNVKNGRAIFPNSIDLENWTNRTKMIYTFETGVKFSVYANSAFLFIESEGMSYTCQYGGDFTEYVERVKELSVGARPAAEPESSKESSK